MRCLCQSTAHTVNTQNAHQQLEPFGVKGIRFCGDGEEDELAVCCPETRRLMDCTVDMVRACVRAYVGAEWDDE